MVASGKYRIGGGRRYGGRGHTSCIIFVLGNEWGWLTASLVIWKWDVVQDVWVELVQVVSVCVYVEEIK